MNESELIEKLRKIEALFAGAATQGERDSAELAREKILRRLREIMVEDPPVEFKFTFPDQWNRRVFIALLRRYDLRPYRYRRQRHTTVMVKVSKRFVDETLWPEFLKLSDQLEQYIEKTTERIISEVLHKDSSEAEVVNRKAIGQRA